MSVDVQNSGLECECAPSFWTLTETLRSATLSATISATHLTTISAVCQICSGLRLQLTFDYLSVNHLMSVSLSKKTNSLSDSGHILSKVYNCRERKNFRPPNI